MQDMFTCLSVESHGDMGICWENGAMDTSRLAEASMVQLLILVDKLAG